MKRTLLAALVCTLAATSAPVAFAQPDRYRGDRDHHEWRRHDEWRKGRRIHDEDWRRGRPVDWRGRHLRRPPRGYEWREVDGNYVMALAATGLIASVIANSR